MKCEPGNHDYRPFPRSRDLFCRFCGDRPGKGFTWNEQADRIEVRAPEQAPLPFQETDPDAAYARQILEEQRRRHREQPETFEERIASIVANAELDGQLSAELISTALEFGEELDLDKFADLVASHRAQPPADDVTEVI
jgi:hypothetical protein